jgi:anaerobic magnesium-protoporphyrin IX monomethyl ester cyclase
MVRRCEPDDIGVSVSYPLPGTPFYERVKSQLGEKRNWLDSDDLAMMYSATYSPDFYRALYALVHAEFRTRKSMRARDPMGFTWHGLRTPMLRWRLSRLSEPMPQSLPLLIPLSTPQAAAIPTDQATLK